VSAAARAPALQAPTAALHVDGPHASAFVGAEARSGAVRVGVNCGVGAFALADLAPATVRSFALRLLEAATAAELAAETGLAPAAVPRSSSAAAARV
jgi:hypothetical protein